MSSKVTNVTINEIKKNITLGAPARSSQQDKPDFKLKKLTGAKSEFGVAAACAGTVFGLSGLKD
jgi:hypothetical protein